MPMNRVPQDVLDLARKAGAKDFEWYSGRVDLGDEDESDRAESSRRAELQRIAENHRRESRKSTVVSEAISKAVSSLRTRRRLRSL